MTRILLNGVGRIGKAILRILSSSNDFCVVAINEKVKSLDNIAYTINYDSTYGRFEDKFYVDNQEKTIFNKKDKIKILNYEKLEEIDFKSLDIDYIIDASGIKVDKDIYLEMGVKNIFVTHPDKNSDINLVLGVNESLFEPEKMKVVSTSSCNSTALSPLIKFIDQEYKIICGDIATVHPLLNHQKVLDSNCISSQDRAVECNFEFGRSSTQNIIPSGTTTVDGISLVCNKNYKEIFSSNSFRVPTACVGAINVTLFLDKEIKSKDEIIQKLQKLEEGQIFKVICNNIEPLVSGDFIAYEYTTVIDHRFTDLKGKNMLKFVLWYDNEWGYASKVVDIVKLTEDKYR